MTPSAVGKNPGPIRAIVPPIGGISLDIFIALLLLYGVQKVLAQAVGS